MVLLCATGPKNVVAFHIRLVLTLSECEKSTTCSFSHNELYIEVSKAIRLVQSPRTGHWSMFQGMQLGTTNDSSTVH